MASLEDSIAALVVEIKELTRLSESQFLSFPVQPLPFNKSNLALEDPNVAFDFSVLVNTIPDDSPQFARKADFIWRLYKKILVEKKLAPPPINGTPYSTAFRNVINTFGEPRMRSDFDFYDTSILPIDLDNQQIWTHLILDNSAVQSIATKLDAVNKEWLSQFRLLDELGKSFVEAVTCEMATIEVIRPWLDPDVFEWRFWDMQDTVFSDGNVPVKGQLPCIISKIVVVRNIKVVVSTAPLPIISKTGTLHKQTGTSISLGASSIAQLVAHSSLRQETSAPVKLVEGAKKTKASEFISHLSASTDKQATSPALPIRMAGLLETQFAVSEAVFQTAPTETPRATDAPVRRFHVPISCDTSAAKTFWTSTLANNKAELISHTTKQAEVQARISKIRDMITAEMEGRVRDHRTPATSPQERIAAMQNPLLQEQQVLQTCEAAIASTLAAASSINNTLAILTVLDAEPVDSQSFVLAMACTRTPKCPNPDPLLFRQAEPT